MCMCVSHVLKFIGEYNKIFLSEYDFIKSALFLVFEGLFFIYMIYVHFFLDKYNYMCCVFEFIEYNPGF